MPVCARQPGRRQLFLAVGVVCLLLSCHSFHLDTPVAEKSVREPAPTTPSKYQFRLSQFLFCSDFELPREQPLFRELAGLREQVYKQLLLPDSNTIVTVYLFEDKDRYERFMKVKYPELPKRRAFFVAQPRAVNGVEDLLVYTYWGERVQQDLRHELTHALLHSVLKDVPLWLDEGLAEYYELPTDRNGLNPLHLDHLCRAPGGPAPLDLARLEQLSQVQQMAPAEYREAWAWVHLMLHDRPEGKALLIAYLHQLRSTPTAGLLRPRLTSVYPTPEEALARYLDTLDHLPRQPVPTVQR